MQTKTGKTYVLYHDNWLTGWKLMWINDPCAKLSSMGSFKSCHMNNNMRNKFVDMVEKTRHTTDFYDLDVKAFYVFRVRPNLCEKECV